MIFSLTIFAYSLAEPYNYLADTPVRTPSDRTSECLKAREELKGSLTSMIEGLENIEYPSDYAQVVADIVDNGKIPDDMNAHLPWIREIYGPANKSKTNPVWWSGFWMQPEGKDEKNGAPALAALAGPESYYDTAMNVPIEAIHPLEAACKEKGSNLYLGAHSELFTTVGLSILGTASPTYYVGLSRQGDSYGAAHVADSWFYGSEIPIYVANGNAHTKLRIKALTAGTDCPALLDAINQHPAIVASGQPANPNACG